MPKPRKSKKQPLRGLLLSLEENNFLATMQPLCKTPKAAVQWQQIIVFQLLSFSEAALLPPLLQMQKALPVNRTPHLQALGLRPFRSSFFLLAVLLCLFPALAARAQDNAAFVSQSVPTPLAAGQQYSVSVTMQNTGTTTWTDGSGYHLGSANPRDNTTWNPPGSRVIHPLNVPPGGKVTFAFLVTAPAAAGNVNFQWQMVHDGVAWFGATSANIVIAVTAPGGQSSRPQIPQGGSTALGATNANGADLPKGTWTISNTSVTPALFIDNTNPQGYYVGRWRAVCVPPQPGWQLHSPCRHL